MDDLSGLVSVIHSAALQDNVIVIIDVTSVTSILIWILFESSIDYHNAVVHCLSVTGVTAVCLIIRSKLLWPGVGNIRGEHFVYRELFQSSSRSHCRYHAMRCECKTTATLTAPTDGHGIRALVHNAYTCATG